MPNMIDVFQKYQGTIDWPQVWNDNVRMVAVKLTNGPKVASPTGDSYVTGARAVGMLVGGYHYALGGDPAFQAHVFAGELLRLVALGIAPALDFEDSSLPTGTAGRRAWIVDFFVALKATLPRLSKVLLYSSGSELQTIAAASITVAGLQVLDWDAEFGPNDGNPHPITHYTGTAAVHQYTSVGRLAGVPTLVDEDQVLVDITEDSMASDFDTQVPVANPDGTVWANLSYGKQVVALVEMLLLGAAPGQPWSGPSVVALLQAMGAQLAALQAAVTALAAAAGTPITQAELTAIIEQAVAQHIQVTGTVQIGPAAVPAVPAAPAG